MPIPAWTSADFLAAFLRLLPRGRAWSREPSVAVSETITVPGLDLTTETGVPITTEAGVPITTGGSETITAPAATMPQALDPLMPTYERQAARAAYLLVDAFPATTDELLPEWEETLGLPDPCAGPSPTLQVRQQQVVARLTAGGGQSVDYFVQFAATLGYTITITQFAPFRAGQSRVGQRLNSRAWAYAWRVNAPSVTVRYFRTGKSAVGEPLASIGNSVLQCELTRLAPAHTYLLFNLGAA